MGTEGTSSGKWLLPDFPHSDWVCEEVYALETQSHLCEMCEVQCCRYVHIMKHPEQGRKLHVGCVCAGNMEGDLEGARDRENDFKATYLRRQRWLTRRWRWSRGNNAFVNTNDGFNVAVYPKGEAWGARVLHRKSGYQRASKLPYQTPDAAKLAALDAMLELKKKQPWEIRRS